MVARRAALLSGVAVATVLIQTGRAVFPGQGGKPTKNEPKIGVGVDGRFVIKLSSGSRYRTCRLV